MATRNLYHRRLTAESASKACWICFKPTSTVLITEAQDDWFNICPGHLKDAKFAIAKDAEDVEKRRREEAIEKEIAAVKKEYEEKINKKKESKKDDKMKREKDKKDEEEKLEKEQDEKLKALEDKRQTEKPTVDGPRIFELHKQFFNMRLQRKHNAQASKRTQERLRNPNAFPSVPKNL